MPPDKGAPDKRAARSLGGQIVSAGEVSRKAMSRLLGIDTLGEPFSVASVAWMDHALELAVDAGLDAAIVLRVEARTPESKGLLLTEHLNVFIRGTEAPEAFVRCVARHGARHLGSWPLERLARLIGEDPEAGKPGLPVPPSADESDRPRSLLDTWGDVDAYADFFAGGELSRSQLDSVDFSRLFRFIQHSDAECTQVNPSTTPPIISLINFPWNERLQRPLGMATPGHHQDDEQGGPADGMLTTDLNEQDVIMGNPDKLRNVLQYALDHGGPDPKPLFVSNTCVPAVTGEDVESVVKEAQASTEQRICYLTVSRRSMTTVFQELMVDRRREAESSAGPPRPQTVNLMGFPSTPAVQELEQLLGAAGIRVNVRFLPDVSHELVARLPEAALNVRLTNRTWQHFFDQLTFDSRTPHVAPTAPYGLEGTHAWLQEVAEALELGPEVEDAWQRHVGPWQDRWRALQQRARSHRLGFVVRDAETFYLTTPGTSWGVPLVALLEEMGFGIDVLVHVSDKGLARENARAVRQLFADPTRHTIRAFDSFAFLRHRLKESPAAAFLSYQFFDWRLTEAGKAAFSIQHLEMGVPGAVRSLERLLQVCETSFFRRYARYLKRTSEGLRVSNKEQRAENRE